MTNDKINNVILSVGVIFSIAFLFAIIASVLSCIFWVTCVITAVLAMEINCTCLIIAIISMVGIRLTNYKIDEQDA